MDGTEKTPEGFIHGIVLDNKGGMKSLSWEESCQVWARNEDIWLHCYYTDEEIHQWLSDNTELNEIVLDSLFSEDSRPHILSRNNNLLAVFRGINLNPNAEPEDMVSLRVWTDGKRMVSTRKRILLSTQDILKHLNEGHGPKDIPELLVEWIDRIVRKMSDTVDNLEDELLIQEEALEGDDLREIRSSLLKIRKQSIGMRRYLAPQREAMNKLINEPLNWLNDMHRLNLRSISERQIRHIEDIDVLRERSGMIQEEISNQMSEQINQRSYVLTLIAAIFLPLSFFTGLMGINVGGMPGVESSIAFWIVTLICIGISLGLIGLFFWRKWV